MSKKQLESTKGEGEAVVKAAPAVKERKQRLGVLMQNFMQCTSYGPHSAASSMKCWQRGQCVWSENDLKMLVDLEAPIRIFVEE